MSKVFILKPAITFVFHHIACFYRTVSTFGEMQTDVTL